MGTEDAQLKCFVPFRPGHLAVFLQEGGGQKQGPEPRLPLRAALVINTPGFPFLSRTAWRHTCLLGRLLPGSASPSATFTAGCALTLAQEPLCCLPEEPEGRVHLRGWLCRASGGHVISVEPGPGSLEGKVGDDKLG